MWRVNTKNLKVLSIILLSIPSILIFAVYGCVAEIKNKDTSKVENTDLLAKGTVEPQTTDFSGKFPLGMNLSGDVSWSRSKMWVNVAKSARDWGHLDKPYQKDLELKLSDRGYPLSDAGLSFEGYEYEPGVWQFSYKGSGDISFRGGGKLLSATRGSDGTVTGTFERFNKKRLDGSLIPVRLIMRNIDSNNPPYDLKIVASGYDLNSKNVYTQEFLEFIKPFKILRYMDLMETNNSTVKTWSDRVKPDAPGRGVAYEDLIELSNVANKEAWITLPHLADDDYIRQTAKLFAQKYDDNLNLYLENSNELWNRNFSQTRYLHDSIIAKLMEEEGLTKAEATAKKGREQLPQKEVVDRLCHIAAIFREEFGPRADLIKPILAGQAANSWHIKKGLEHLAMTGRQESCNLHAIGIAPYINTQYGPTFNPASMDEVFAKMREFYEEKVKLKIVEHAALAKQYNLKLYAYEGGQHLNGDNAFNIKTAAQNDPRMGELLKDYFCFWQNSGGEDFVFFSSITGNSKHGHWGIKTSISEGETIKHNALIDTVEKGACHK